MQFLIVFISYIINTQHVSSDIRPSSGVLFTVHTASGFLRCYLSVALSCCKHNKTVHRKYIPIYIQYNLKSHIFICTCWIFSYRDVIHCRSCVNNHQDALYRLIYYSNSALHVSGDVFAHHREHLTVFTVSGSVHPSCCWVVSWTS
jgi:hypothetical protein